MAVVNGTVHSVRTMESGAWDPTWQLAEILFTVAGVYAQADNGTLANVASLIQNSRRNGKTVTMRAVMAGRPATKASDNTYMTLGGVTIDTTDVDFVINGPDWATELANGAMPEQNRPFALLVAFTES